MQFIYDDGGRSAAGFKGRAGDCVARSVAIVTGKSYEEVYSFLAKGNAAQRKTKHCRTAYPKRSAGHGINTRRRWFKEYMNSLGFEWIPTMTVGIGCKVHLREGELPPGRLVVSVSKHFTAVIDGVIYDTHDPQRRTYWYDPDGRVKYISYRCVYGYYKLADSKTIH